MAFRTETDRIKAAEEWAREKAQDMTDTVAEYGLANVISDLMHEYLMRSAPSRELIDDTDALDDEDDWSKG